MLIQAIAGLQKEFVNIKLTHEKAEKERINRQTETIPPEKKVEFVSSVNTRYQVSKDTMQQQQSTEIGSKI
ncbi:hypothetical protein [Okeania sp. KiyG1]|uniref:hypothetical protein n=1 Tax=Okeania sp. KiyG1 TaxID=2720165 RepID=UPI0019ADAEEA|nr:hypothetical protein [Okeania sp. KiyG1]GGA01370.1 hypothetical protein CYANOKiyG1_13170 [Okeania sp. KiyG1]